MKMKSLPPLLAAIFFFPRKAAVIGLSISLLPRSGVVSQKTLRATVPGNHLVEQSPHEQRLLLLLQRRALLSIVLVASSSAAFSLPSVSVAASSIPSVTSAEFDTILKDSAKSILSVELSGPKSETAVIRLVDGTTFTISDLVESSTDPRSPLKLISRCRLYGIPVKNTGLISALSGKGSIISESGRKKKSYMNQRVQEAQRKEQEKKERIAEDERERLKELYMMEEKGFLND